MTRHDEPAEGDVAGVAEVLAAHVYANPGCRCGWSRNHASGDGPRKWTDHVADALRDLLAAAEQRGRVAALREVEEAPARSFIPSNSLDRMLNSFDGGCS